jgi:multidrug efflux system outer membrane protein
VRPFSAPGVKTGVAISAAALLSACAVGPAYKAPTPMAGTSGTFVAAADPRYTADQPAGDWWRLYRDPALDGLVGEALANNRDIAQAAANLAQVRAILSEARSGFLPATNTSASATRARQPNPLTGQMITTDTSSVGIDVSYEVDLFGRVRRAVEAARADAGSAQAALDVVRISVAAETARAYADACASNVQIDVANRTVALLQNSSELTQRQFEAGRGSGLDLARARSLVETTRAAIPPLEAQRDAALFRLAVLIGKPPSQAPAAARACKAIPAVTTPIPVGDGENLLRRRPDVRQAERNLAAATARIGVATADLYPNVTLGGGLATLGGQGNDLFKNHTYSVGPLISWSFPNIVAARARVKQADAAAQGALAAFDQANLNALQETETSLSAYAKALDRTAALQRARDEAARALDLSRTRQREGLDSGLTIIDAERTLADAESQLALSQSQTASAQITVFKALGGGWEQASS